MVVAAYKSVGEGYASRYAAELNKQGFNADYGLSYSKNMYFVYINRYDDKTTAINKINSTREDTPFKATWVYSYKAKIHQLKRQRQPYHQLKNRKYRKKLMRHQ